MEKCAYCGSKDKVTYLKNNLYFCTVGDCLKKYNNYFKVNSNTDDIPYAVEQFVIKHLTTKPATTKK
jgi:hypothetical protein